MEQAPTLSPVPGSQVPLLFGLSVAMFVGAFAAGYLPLTITISASRMKLLTVFGAGILIGTALNVIIPEGLHMWFSAPAEGSHGSHEGPHQHEHEHEGESDHGHKHGGSDWQIGAAMAVGFAFMLLVDRISGEFGHAHSGTVEEQSVASSSGGGKSQSAMLGLIVHAAVDGVALGATLFAGAGEASWIVFFAIMLHKAPASFGLTTYLMRTTENLRVIKSNLLIFALAAPVGAFGTYYGMYLGLFGYDLKNLALIMLFSGGTFLFVATAHILPDIIHNSGHLTWLETALNAIGVIVPIFITVPHGH